MKDSYEARKVYCRTCLEKKAANEPYNTTTVRVEAVRCRILPSHSLTVPMVRIFTRLIKPRAAAIEVKCR